MKHISLFTILFLIPVLLFNTGCKKETPKLEPFWTVATVGNYPYTMTAVVTLPVLLSHNTDKQDEMAAFINGECRGVGTMQMISDLPVYFILIHGASSEQGQVEFRYFSLKKKAIFGTSSSVPFVIDQSYGSVDSPFVLTLKKMP